MAFNAKVTRKVIRKVWFDYMIEQYSKQYAAKHGAYNKNRHSIRDGGEVVIKDNDGNRVETLDEVGRDYGTFRTKFNTSDNPTWDRENKRPEPIVQLELGFGPKMSIGVWNAAIEEAATSL